MIETPIEIPSISTEPISTLIVSDNDPTALDVVFAFTAVTYNDEGDPTFTEPAGNVWKSGAWGTAALQPDERWQTKARIPIGPGTDFALTDGDWAGWVRVLTATPNGPTRPFVVVRIT